MALSDFLLVKKIVSREGKLHFRRWALFQSPFFNVYVHCVSKSDEERDPHDHPFWFASWVLRGGYTERVWDQAGNFLGEFTRKPGRLVTHPTTEFHRLRLLGNEAWTLVVTGPRTHEPWGYLTKDGWVDHVTYRKQKHSQNVA